jgi:hypothetical protein
MPFRTRQLGQRASVAGRRRRSRGQSLTEFALVLPVMLLLVTFGIDFGRVFLGWIDLNNVARVAANYAAENPTAWNTVNPDLPAQTEYVRLVTTEAAGINCTLPVTLPAPVFPDGPNGQNGIGQPVTVSITCSFGLITPIISNILGNAIPVSASAAFPIRNGFIPDMPSPTPTPTPSPTPSPTPVPTATPTPTPTPSPTPTSATPTPTPAPTPTPTPAMCTVPALVGQNVKFAADIWGSKGHGSTPGAGFQTTLLFSPLYNGTASGSVTAQTLLAGMSLPCATTANTVTWH